MQYFIVNPTSGEVSIRRSLLNDDTERYTVSTFKFSKFLLYLIRCEDNIVSRHIRTLI